MKKTISIMLTLLMTIVFTAFADTPSQVKDDMSAYRDDSRNKSDETDFTYIPISELSENAEAALNGSYSQFSISDKIKFVQPDELHIMSFEKITNAIDNYEKAMALFFSAEELSSQNVVTQNIYTLLIDKFFMPDGTIGKFADTRESFRDIERL